MSKLKTIKYIFLEVQFICVLLCLFALDSSAAEIAVIKSRNIKPYDIALAGFKEVVNGNIHENNIDGDIKKGIAITDRLKSEKIDLILTFGTEASYMASQNIKTIPVVFSMTSNPPTYSTEKPNVTGVRIDIPLKTQFHFLREVLPEVKRIGIIYSSDDVERFIDETKEMIAGAGGDIVLQFVPVRITNIKELPRAVEKILLEADSLWLFYDSVVTSSQRIVQNIIIFPALKKNIPIIGFNKWSVASGALYCLYSEYKDIGRQTGEIAKRILMGEKPYFIPVESPKDIKILFNDKVFERISSNIEVNMPRNAYLWRGELKYSNE
jgi:putative ABC transport system substrate-binding protein